MDLKVDVVYEIKQGESWRSEKGIDIKSNIDKDELIDCRIAKSLVNYLLKESVVLEPDKLLLSIAEAQRRDIQLNLESLDDMTLNAKTMADKAHQNMLQTFEDNESRYAELRDKFEEVRGKFSEKILATSKDLEKDIKKAEDLSARLKEIDNYSLERISNTLTQILELVKQDPELVKLVLNYKQDK